MNMSVTVITGINDRVNRKTVGVGLVCLLFGGGGFFVGRADGSSKAGSTNATSIATLRMMLEPLEGTGIAGDVSIECLLGRNSEKDDSIRSPKLRLRLPDNFDKKELKNRLARAGWSESRSQQIGGDMSFSLSPGTVLSISAGVASLVVEKASC
jgi:hypothetical protein